MSADARTLIFVSMRAGGQGALDLWMSTRRTADDPWGEPVNLGDGINSHAGDTLPFLSADGRILIYNSNRDGNHHPWIAERGRVADPWDKARPFTEVGRRVNRFQLLDFGSALFNSPWKSRCSVSHWNPETKQWDASGTLTPCADGGHGDSAFYCEATSTLYFDSDRPGGQGKTDLWMSRRVKKQQSTPAAAPTDYDRLQGSWVCVEAVMGNKPLSKEALAATTLMFDHDQIEARGIGAKPLRWKYALGGFRGRKWIGFFNGTRQPTNCRLRGSMSSKATRCKSASITQIVRGRAISRRRTSRIISWACFGGSRPTRRSDSRRSAPLAF
jgi:hypothetical protein